MYFDSLFDTATSDVLVEPLSASGVNEMHQDTTSGDVHSGLLSVLPEISPQGGDNTPLETNTCSQAVMNRLWSRLILSELSRFGVTDVCVAPGSRSTPLTLEADAHAALTLHTHFDERGLGFFALGMAKATHRPVAVIVTSGTAVANLLPAVVESRLTGAPLILLTADRPVDLMHCGANQAIEQAGIFSQHVTHAVALPSPSERLSAAWLLTTVDHACVMQRQQGGAIHLNCPFPEPLYTDAVISAEHPYLQSVVSWQSHPTPYGVQQFASCDGLLLDSNVLTQRGVLIIGAVSHEMAMLGQSLAQQLGWPVLCDPQSGVSSDWAHYDVWLQHDEARALLSQTQVVLQLGGLLVSKRLCQWLAQHLSSGHARYYYVSERATRYNPSHLPQHHIVTPLLPWLTAQQHALDRLLIEHSDARLAWLDDLRNWSWVVEHLMASPQRQGHPLETHVFASDDRYLTEIEVARSLSQLGQHVSANPSSVQSAPIHLFLGNSLMIRLVDMFSHLPNIPVYANRGASGIDGLIATAAGIHQGTHASVVLCLGDTACLHDLNSLSLFSRTQAPCVLIVTNNDGGGIFDLLPVPDAQKTALYQMPHGYQFEQAAHMFGLQYGRPTTVSDYHDMLESHLSQGEGTLLIEVVVPPAQAAQHIQHWVECLCAL